jgi:hypothetical protein
VARRVAEYPERAYLLGYCSPAVTGEHDVRITLANQTTLRDATCRFDASQFGVGQGACDAAFLTGYCAARTCATYLACGECAADAAAPGSDQWSFTPAAE